MIMEKMLYEYNNVSKGILGGKVEEEYKNSTIKLMTEVTRNVAN